MPSSASVSVRISQGTVVGTHLTLPNGGKYFAFKGIPYAVPPVGELRFKASVPLHRFNEEPLDCTKERSVCYQKDQITGEMVGGENCLFLNVYTPRVGSSKPLPVMVWIHGGAFLAGSGNSDFYLPLYLLQEDVVVVTLNYRLGILGFLHLPDGDIHGNAGLGDQLLALKWVRGNVDKFNGNPENVTLFGHSAGGASVHLHTLSPESKKYFHKAIIQSGNALMDWATQRQPLYKARKLADLLGCKAEDDKEIGEFLRQEKDLDRLYMHMMKVLTPEERRRDLPMPFKPVIEESAPNAIIPKSPLETLMERNTIEIPIMMGYTSKEGILMLPSAARNFESLDQDLARLIPRRLKLEPNDPAGQKLAEDMRQLYFKGGKVSEHSANELADLLSDYHFIIGTYLAAELHSRRQHKSLLYFYRFSFDGECNLLKMLHNFEGLKGACHADDLFYLFQMSTRDLPFKPGSREEKLVERMCRMWSNFAKHSNPTPPEDNSLGFKWDPVKKTGDRDEFVLDCLEIDDDICMNRDPEKERINFWRNVFKTWNGGFIKAKL